MRIMTTRMLATECKDRCSILTVALALALILSISGLVTSAAASPLGASPGPLTLSPTSGPPGTVVRYTGTGFTAGGKVTVLLVPGLGLIVDEVIADPTGGIRGDFTMAGPGGEVTYGAVGVFAIDEATRRESPPTTFTLIEPNLTRQTWYFAEGSTQPPFDTWFLVQNPGIVPATIRFTFQLPEGGTITRFFSVGPTSRFSLYANQVIPNQAFSTRIDSDQQVFAERAMYVGYDGTAVTGIPGPDRTWLFAEGATTLPFQTWLLLQNPNPQPTTATITYLLQGGAAPRTQSLSLPPLSRTSVFVNQVLPNQAFSARVASDLPIVAERAMYRFPGNAATADPGVTRPNPYWRFPDGNTTQGAVPVDTFLLLQNPNDTPVGVAIDLVQNGTRSLHIRQLPPHSRVSVFLNEVLPNARFGIEVNADLPIIAERSEFFGIEPRGAIATAGSTNPSTTWLLPEGSTQPPFTEVIAIFNDSGALMSAHLDFQLPSGEVIGRDLTIGPNRTVWVNVNAVVPEQPVSTKVTTSVPSFVERLMFMNKSGALGGTDAMGIPQ